MQLLITQFFILICIWHVVMSPPLFLRSGVEWHLHCHHFCVVHMTPPFICSLYTGLSSLLTTPLRFANVFLCSSSSRELFLGKGCSGAAAHRAVESPSSQQSSGNCRPSAIYWSLCLICLGCIYSSLQSVPLGCAFPLVLSTFAFNICEPDFSFCTYTFKIVQLGRGLDPVTTI